MHTLFGGAAAALTALLLGGGAVAQAAEPEPAPAVDAGACEVTVETGTHRLERVLRLTCASLEPGWQARAVASVNTPRNLDEYILSTWEGSWLQTAPGSVGDASAIRIGTIISDLRVEYAPIGG